MYQLTVAKYTRLTFEVIKSNILSAMEYRVSFLVQVFGMLINDSFLVLIWYFFFQTFPKIKGWTLEDTFLLFVINTINFALVMIFAGGARTIASTISKGQLDYFLGFPKNVLWHLSVSKTDISAIGDLLCGIAIYLIFVPVTLEKTLWIAILSVLSGFIMYSFIVLTQSLAFFVGDFENGAEQFFQSMLTFTLYPQSIFNGALKVIMLTVLPAFFIAAVPVSLVQNFSLPLFLLMVSVGLVIFTLAVTVFKYGLKKYESGNLINLNM